MVHTEALDWLREGIAQLTSSEEWQRWLSVQRRFSRYSWGNTLLIALQRPDATQVAGFHAWLRMGRHVRKGEKGIAILAPILRRVRVKDDETVIVGSPSAFRVTHVFDIRQTDGEELPAPPVSMLQGDDPDALYTRLRSVAAAVGYTVEEDYLDGQNGDCTPGERRIRIEVRNQPAQQVKTLAHELAHAILHADLSGLPRKRKELEQKGRAFADHDTATIGHRPPAVAAGAPHLAGQPHPRRGCLEASRAQGGRERCAGVVPIKGGVPLLRCQRNSETPGESAFPKEFLWEPAFGGTERRRRCGCS
jgi:hypothetical protein